jgi:peroxiredoxin
MKKNLNKSYWLKTFLLACAICFFNTSYGQTFKAFKISGDLKKVKVPIKKITLYYWVGSTGKSDTSVVKNGKYFFSGKISESQLVYLRNVTDSEDEQIISASFYMDPGVIQVTSDTLFSNLKVTGSKSDVLYRTWQDQLLKKQSKLSEIYRLRDSCWRVFQSSKNPEDSLAMAKYHAQASMISSEQMEISIDYAKTHLNSPIVMDVIASIWMPKYADQQEEIFFMVPESNRQTRVGKELASKMAVRLGHKAPDFSITDTAGKMVRLSSFKGKYILLEFWASWCVPCRHEAPYLKEAFKSYSDKGFTIFSVSLDKSDAKKEWMDAIHKDGTGLWTQTSSLTGKYNAASIAYGSISNIPANFLIDPQGNIIAKD